MFDYNFNGTHSVYAMRIQPFRFCSVVCTVLFSEGFYKPFCSLTGSSRKIILYSKKSLEKLFPMTFIYFFPEINVTLVLSGFLCM